MGVLDSGWERPKISYHDQLLFLIMMVMVLSFSLVFSYVGHGTYLLGCFLAGVCLSGKHEPHHVWVRQTKRMTSWMIRIFFACTVAFAIPVEEFLTLKAVFKGFCMGIGP